MRDHNYLLNRAEFKTGLTKKLASRFRGERIDESLRSIESKLHDIMDLRWYGKTMDATDLGTLACCFQKLEERAVKNDLSEQAIDNRLIRQIIEAVALEHGITKHMLDESANKDQAESILGPAFHINTHNYDRTISPALPIPERLLDKEIVANEPRTPKALIREKTEPSVSMRLPRQNRPGPVRRVPVPHDVASPNAKLVEPPPVVELTDAIEPPASEETQAAKATHAEEQAPKRRGRPPKAVPVRPAKAIAEDYELGWARIEQLCQGVMPLMTIADSSSHAVGLRMPPSKFAALMDNAAATLRESNEIGELPNERHATTQKIMAELRALHSEYAQARNQNTAMAR